MTARTNEVWKPVIAAVNGLCVGAGFHFVADADIVVASQVAVFMDSTYRLARCRPWSRSASSGVSPLGPSCGWS